MIVRKLLSQIFRRSGELLFRIASKVSPAPLPFPQKAAHQKMAEQWVVDRGDQTLRLDYDLNESSLVMDLGGYEGQWASDIFARFRCTIHIFEPVEAFVTQIKRRFSANPNIHVHHCGLAGETRKLSIAVCNESSSIFRESVMAEQIQLVCAADCLRKMNLTAIDLMKINIEGGEYELLEHLIDSDLIKMIRDLQVQFHQVIADAEGKMNRIQRNLARTHALTYQYPFVWENWRRVCIATESISYPAEVIS